MVPLSDMSANSSDPTSKFNSSKASFPPGSASLASSLKAPNSGISDTPASLTKSEIDGPSPVTAKARSLKWIGSRISPLTLKEAPPTLTVNSVGHEWPDSIHATIGPTVPLSENGMSSKAPSKSSFIDLSRPGIVAFKWSNLTVYVSPDCPSLYVNRPFSM
ncbi:hypothetical protein ES703_91949 [subsurface metagenome]